MVATLADILGVVVAGCMIKLQLSANSENVLTPDKPATKAELHDMMLALKL